IQDSLHARVQSAALHFQLFYSTRRTFEHGLHRVQAIDVFQITHVPSVHLALTRRSRLAARLALATTRPTARTGCRCGSTTPPVGLAGLAAPGRLTRPRARPSSLARVAQQLLAHRTTVVVIRFCGTVGSHLEIDLAFIQIHPRYLHANRVTQT